MIVLDTNVISALMEPHRNAVVVDWLDRQPTMSIWTTAITVFEARFGIERLAKGPRRDALAHALAEMFRIGLRGRILGFAEPEATETAALMAARQATGRPASISDSMIAGTVRVHRATLATRNVRHFEGAGIVLVDPWAGA